MTTVHISIGPGATEEQAALAAYAQEALPYAKNVKEAHVAFPSPFMPDYAVKVVLLYDSDTWGDNTFHTLKAAYDFMEGLSALPHHQTGADMGQLEFTSDHSTKRQTELAEKAQGVLEALGYEVAELSFAKKPKVMITATSADSDTSPLHTMFTNYQKFEAWLDEQAEHAKQLELVKQGDKTAPDPSEPDPWGEPTSGKDPWDEEPIEDLTPSQKAKKSPLEVAEANDQKDVENLKAEPDEAPANAGWDEVPDAGAGYQPTTDTDAEAGEETELVERLADLLTGHVNEMSVYFHDLPHGNVGVYLPPDTNLKIGKKHHLQTANVFPSPEHLADFLTHVDGAPIQDLADPQTEHAVKTGALTGSHVSDATLAYAAPQHDEDAMKLVDDTLLALDGLGSEREVTLLLYEHTDSVRMIVTIPDGTSEGKEYTFEGTRATLEAWLPVITSNILWIEQYVQPGTHPIPQGKGDLETMAETAPLKASMDVPEPAPKTSEPEPTPEFEPVSDDELFAEEDDPELLAQQKAEQASESFATASHQKQVEQMQARQQAEDSLHTIMGEIENLLDRERRGEIDKNESRWRKGEAVFRADTIAEDFKRAGDTERDSRAKVLRHVREEVTSRRNKRGVIDSAGRLTQNEIALTSKAYRAFVQTHDNWFNLVDQLDEHGNLITDDAGDPWPEMHIGTIALNKAYVLADAATAETRNRLLSFAWRYDEATCRLLAKALKQQGGKNPASAVDPILSDFYTQRMEITTDTGYHAETQLDNAHARDYLRTLVPSAASEVRSIKIDKALYEGTWTNTLRHFSVLWQWLGNPVDENTGLMSNSQALERILERVAPHENGFSGLVEMMVWSGEMTEAQASEFIEQHMDYEPKEEVPA